jgi:hypothetical protein
MLEQVDTVIGFVSVMLLLSMIITVVVQAISGLLDLRGQNLVWGLANLFQQISPDAAQRAATELANAVASHSSVTPTSKGGFYKAKAIRTDELLMVLQKLSAEAAKDPNALSDAAKSLLNSLLTNSVPGNSGNTETMQKLAAEFAKRFPMHKVMLQDALNDIAGKTTLIAAGVDKWFHTIMDRASDRFERNCRFWTIAGAAVLAFGFHVNSISIYQQISKDPTVRSKLAANADSLTQQAEKTIGGYPGSQAVSNMADPKSKGDQGNGAVGGQVNKGPSFQFTDSQRSALRSRPADLVNCAQVNNWAATNNELKNPDVLNAIDVACKQEAANQLKALNPNLAQMKDQLAEADLDLFHRFSLAQTSWGEFGGEFVTLLLLSLGAPFWYNALRQLSNLKPAISSKVSDERKQAEQAAVQTTDQAQAAAASGGANG